MKMPQKFRPKITVFGETFKCIDVSTDATGEPLILYRVIGQGSDSRAKVASLEDWMAWDKNSIEG